MPASPAPQLQDSSSHGLPPHDMVPPLEASSLLLLGGLLHAAAGSSYNISQPPSLSGLVGQSVTLPCSFTFPAEIKPIRAPDIYWRRQSFHGEFIYNHTEGFTHASYRGRISLVGDPQQQSGSIQIRDLKVSDTNMYFCCIRVQWYNNGRESECWQSNPGTRLTVQEQPTPEPGMPMAAIVGGLVGAALLILALGLTAFFLTRRKGSRQNGACRSKEPGRPEAEKPTVYEEVREGGFGGPLAASNPPAVPHKQDLVYAALTLSEVDAVSKKPAVQEAPGTETVYSALRV
uniref:Ig-like domain-containing protein n=1 Tax=Sphenodon punctatus TaxID=8508 RepID=A0A8D0HN03_SPHPU